jgi:hypothetical protein
LLHPSQFEVGDAWIAFRLNDRPIVTLEDGSFNCVSIMDAASCYICGAEMVPAAGDEDMSQLHARRLLQAALSKSERYPATMFVPEGQFQGALATEAARKSITVVSVPESQLLVFTGEAIAGYREHMQGKSGREA